MALVAARVQLDPSPLTISAGSVSNSVTSTEASWSKSNVFLGRASILTDEHITSEAALNMLTVHRIKVNSANPGYTKTDLNDNQGTQPVQVGAI